MAVLLLQLSSVQDYLRREGEAYLQRKLQTKVRIGYLRARGWQYLELRNVYVADTASRALLYTGSLKVHYNLLSFLNNELHVNKLEWDTLLVNVYRHAGDSAFNYQFIIDAFTGPAEPDTLVASTGTTLQFYIKDVSLRQVRVSYIDEPAGMTAVLRWASLHVDPDDLLIDDGLYAFRGITLNGLTGFFRQAWRPEAAKTAAPPPEPEDTTAAPFHLLLKKLQVQNSTFWYADEGMGISTAWKVGRFSLSNSNIDQDSSRIQVGDIRISHTQGLVTLTAARDTVAAPATDSTASSDWQVLTTNALLERLTFRYDNNTAPPAHGAGPGKDPDYNHVLLSNFSTHVGDIRYKTDTVSAVLHQLSLREQSGLAVKQAHMRFLFTPQTLSLQDLLLETNQTLIRKQIAITVPSWSTVSDRLDELQIRANLDSSRIALGEWLPFVPDARKNKAMDPLWDKHLTVTTQLKGSLGLLNIQHLYIRDNVGNILHARGEVAHAANPDSLRANLDSIVLHSGNKALRAWLPAGTLPDTPRLPEQLLLTGSFKGGMQDMQTQLELQSDLASANLTAHLLNITDSVRSLYNISIPYFRIHPGLMMYDTTLGWISGRLEAEGQGYELATMSANGNIQLNEATYNGYTYRDIDVKAGLDNQRFQASGQSRDTAIAATFDVNGRLQDTVLQELKANLQVDSANLYATHWYSEPLDLKGALTADFSSLQPQRLEGNAFLTGWQIATNGQVFALDTVSALAHWEDQQYLALQGPFGFIKANGAIDYTKIGPAFSQVINKPLQPVDSAQLTPPPPGQLLEWTASLYWPKSLQPMLPDLHMDVPLDIQGRLNSDSSLLIMNAALPKLTYDSLIVDSLLLQAQIRDTALKAAVTLAGLRHPVAPLHYTELLANANAGKLDWDLSLEDVKRKPKYKVGGLVQFLPDSVIALSLKPDLLLNKQPWNVEENNIIRLRNGLPDSANLNLSYKEQSIRLQTTPDTSGSRFPALKADIGNFQLATITGLLAADTLLATGVLNGQAHITNLDQSPLIASTLKVDSLTFRNARLGTLDADLQTTPTGAYNVKAALRGNDNDLQAEGSYDSTINATVNINKVNMASLEPFTFGNVTRMRGTADGQFTIAGTTDAPQVRGRLHFANAGGNITYIGAPLHLPDEEVIFDEKGILFNKFVIADSLNNELVVNGRVNTTNFTDFAFMLDVNASNFMVLGKQESADQLFYGPAFVDSRIRIRGNLDLPRIDAFVKLRDKSKVTVTLPQDEPGVANREGVMVFVDRSNPVDSAALAKLDSIKYENPHLKGLVFSGNAEITPESVIKIIIDEQNGDFVEAKGTANINATLDPSSKLSLTGRYEIQEGKYEMSLNQLIKRSFDIQKGSFISFNGDAMSADLDITAKYTVNAPAIDLVGDQLSNASDLERNRYKQRLPFEVYLEIKGELMKPDITFRLDMPEKDRNAFNGSVYNRLKQINQVSSELNKQVMGLLVLNSFIPEDPLAASGAGVDVGREARKSVSKILTQQLNNLAGSLIKGVDINFDLQSSQDYSSGTAKDQTALNVGVSKNLFNDRLSVSVGSNIMLEGNKQASNASSLVGDISVEYKLTRDGRYRIRVYQRNTNETVIQGQVVETGAAFALVMDYDEFREILQRSKKEKEKEKLRATKKDK